MFKLKIYNKIANNNLITGKYRRFPRDNWDVYSESEPFGIGAQKFVVLKSKHISNPQTYYFKGVNLNRNV